MSDFLDRWAPLMAFLFLAIVGGYAIQQSAERDARILREALVDACERANHRDEIANERTAITAEVLLSAADSREREARIADSDAERRVNLHVANRYRNLAAELPFVELVDCEATVPFP